MPQVFWHRLDMHAAIWELFCEDGVVFSGFPLFPPPALPSPPMGCSREISKMHTLSSVMQPLSVSEWSPAVDANSTACKCADWIRALKCTLEIRLRVLHLRLIITLFITVWLIRLDLNQE